MANDPAIGLRLIEAAEQEPDELMRAAFATATLFNLSDETTSRVGDLALTLYFREPPGPTRRELEKLVEAIMYRDTTGIALKRITDAVTPDQPEQRLMAFLLLTYHAADRQPVALEHLRAHAANTALPPKVRAKAGTLAQTIVDLTPPDRR